jgi:hypothetical protein
VSRMTTDQPLGRPTPLPKGVVELAFFDAWKRQSGGAGTRDWIGRTAVCEATHWPRSECRGIVVRRPEGRDVRTDNRSLVCVRDRPLYPGDVIALGS